MKTLQDPKTESHALVAVVVSFAPNGTSNPLSASNRGDGFTVTRAGGAGLFDVVFDEAYAEFIGATQPGLQLATAGDQHPQLGAWTAATRTLRVRIWDASDAAPADLAADPDNRMTFMALFRNSAVQR